ncbi:MAG TPA: AfsR/SARP family transcriptional regulator [Amycolatopsis sp.]|nr:AfsR/SARP family transcriptional regulator [Amycolatopsis sp.]
MSAEICLLGLLEVSGPNGVVSWSGGRRRSLFALLALRAGRLVSRDSLIDGLWGEQVPATAVKTLQSHITHLRKALSAAGLGELVTTRDPGYLLVADQALVDVHRFGDHVRAGRAALEQGDHARAIGRLGAGLALWRGEPLTDCPVDGWADAEITCLREARASAEEQLAEALCLTGRHAEAIGALERLVVRYPLRERMWGLLMIAYHGAGQQADALRTYRRVRSVLVGEFGIEPGHELRRLETAVLAGRPRLDPVA